MNDACFVCMYSMYECSLFMMYEWMNVCMYVCIEKMYVCMYECSLFMMYEWMYVCMYGEDYVCMHVCMFEVCSFAIFSEYFLNFLK